MKKILILVTIAFSFLNAVFPQYGIFFLVLFAIMCLVAFCIKTLEK